MKPLTRFSPYLPRMAEIVDKQILSERTIKLNLKPEEGQKVSHKPGQFVMISLMATGEAAFCIASAPGKETFEIVVQRVGQITEALHRLEPGAKIGYRGPLGKPFPLDAFLGRDVLLLAGGLGYAALRSLLLQFLSNRGDFGRIILLAGFKRLADRIFSEELECLEGRNDLDILMTLDKPEPGWMGRCGLVTELIAEAAPDPDKTTAAVVGPPAMMPSAVDACRRIGMQDDRIYLSLERSMQCGLGKCGHCQINDINVCVDGPVFRLDRLVPLDEALEAPARS